MYMLVLPYELWLHYKLPQFDNNNLLYCEKLLLHRKIITLWAQDFFYIMSNYYIMSCYIVHQQEKID